MTVSGFISRAACRGHRPSHFASQAGLERPALVGQLLKERGVARFIVAPSGYGKTYLAAEYAQTVCSWNHTFWINAQSPCFLRDLDAASIAAQCRAFDDEVALVVFDDVPALDPGRQALFSSEIDELLAAQCEVLVTCTPSCDTASPLQRDRIRLGAESLLLDDDELDAARSADERARKPASRIGQAGRVPQLVWGGEPEDAARFAQGALGEDLPSDVMRVMASALVLQSGTVRDLAGFCAIDDTLLEEIAGDYPHLGIDDENGRFEAPPIGAEALASPLKKRLPALIARSRFKSPEDLVCRWASALVKAGKPARACAVMSEACPRRARAEWVLGNVPELVRQACFFPMMRLLAHREGASPETRMGLDAAEALCRRVLGDEEGALRFAKRNAFNAKAPEGVRIVSLLVIARLATGPLAARAGKELRDACEAADAQHPAANSNWMLLAQAWRAARSGLAEMGGLWEALAEAGADDGVLCIATSWLFALFEGHEQGLDGEVALTKRHAERLVRERLAACAAGGAIDYFAASAGLSMEEAHARGMAYDEGPLEAGFLAMLRRVEMDVLSQRRLFEEGEELDRVQRGDWAATHHTAMFNEMHVAGQARPERSVPVLGLRMFGCFEVSIGGEPVDYKQFKRRNTRVLLVLLAVNQGRELSRDMVAEAMWPQSSDKVARKNFYTVWSQLRRILSLPDGTCPYLVRRQHGCSLDTRYVQSDVGRLNDICRELLFSTPNIERWSTLFSEIDCNYTSDLMPTEQGNALIAQARNDYRSRLVDALVAATMSVVGTENAQWGVWFARAAVGRDETREDAYVALMRAQIAVNQRTAAMMTYLKCRRVLSNQLGIDPSPETTALYEGLLDAR